MACSAHCLVDCSDLLKVAIPVAVESMSRLASCIVGEFVMSRKQRAGLASAIRMLCTVVQLRGGYAEGGYVGDAPALRKPDLQPANSNAAPIQQISISAPVTVTGSSGTPKQNADLAKQIGAELEAAMRGVVVDGAKSTDAAWKSTQRWEGPLTRKTPAS